MKIVTKTSSSSGINTSIILFLILLTLKLTHIIDWSWWWITCPLWIGFALFLSIILFVIGVAIIVSFISKF